MTLVEFSSGDVPVTTRRIPCIETPVWLTACALAVTAPIVRADDAKPAPTKYTYVTGNAVSGAGGGTTHGVSGGVLICEQQSMRPVAWFGAAKPTDGKSQFIYLLIFKTAEGFKGRDSFELSWSGRGSSDDGVEGTMAVAFSKKKVEVEYKFPTDRKTHALLKHSLKIGGQEVKDGDPRVFVVDLTGEKVTYTPVKVELPKVAPDVSQEKSDEWGPMVQQAIDKLKADSPELKKLLDAGK